MHCLSLDSFMIWGHFVEVGEIISGGFFSSSLEVRIVFSNDSFMRRVQGSFVFFVGKVRLPVRCVHSCISDCDKKKKSRKKNFGQCYLWVWQGALAIMIQLRLLITIMITTLWNSLCKMPTPHRSSSKIVFPFEKWPQRVRRKWLEKELGRLSTHIFRSSVRMNTS